MNIHVSEKEA